MTPFGTPSAIGSSDIGRLVATVVFYAFVVVVAFLSASTVYILNKYSKSHLLALVVTIIYGIIFLSLVSAGISIVNGL